MKKLNWDGWTINEGGQAYMGGYFAGNLTEYSLHSFTVTRLERPETDGGEPESWGIRLEHKDLWAEFYGSTLKDVCDMLAHYLDEADYYMGSDMDALFAVFEGGEK